jgi:hypothetical protein
VTLPILPVLAATLAAGPSGDLSFVIGEKGEPLTKESFGNAFRKACRAAGVPGSAHGVRKVAATRAAENGATVTELEAIFGLARRRRDGGPLHPGGQSGAAREGGHAQARERRWNIYSRT